MLSASQAFVGVASKIVQQNVPVVVAMQYEIINAAASQFAYEFYERLAKDNSVDIAVQNGRLTLALDSQYRNRGFATPAIFMRVQDGYLFHRQSKEAEIETPSSEAPRFTQATGRGAVAIGGNANGSTIVTGRDNVVGSGHVVQRNVNQRGKYNINLGSTQNLNIGDTINNDQE